MSREVLVVYPRQPSDAPPALVELERRRTGIVAISGVPGGVMWKPLQQIARGATREEAISSAVAALDAMLSL